MSRHFDYPINKAANWKRTEVAHLSDVVKGFIAYQVHSELPTANTELKVTKHANRYARSRKVFPENRFQLDWYLLEAKSENPRLARVTNKIIHLACVPTPDKATINRTMRPYTDTLFLGGDLEVTIPVESSLAGSDYALDLGKVIGLTIIAKDGAFPVCTPKD